MKYVKSLKHEKISIEIHKIIMKYNRNNIRKIKIINTVNYFNLKKPFNNQ